MANTQQPELKEPGPSDTQLPDFRKSNVRRLITLNFCNKNIYVYTHTIYRKVNN